MYFKRTTSKISHPNTIQLDTKPDNLVKTSQILRISLLDTIDTIYQKMVKYINDVCLPFLGASAPNAFSCVSDKYILIWLKR